MTKLGMNADAVESLAIKLDTQASGISTAIAQIEALVNRARGEWRGNDAQAFADWWHTKHKPAMQRAHDSIAGLARSAKNNVAEQKGVSGTSGHGTAPSTPGGHHVTPPAPAPAAPPPAHAAHNGPSGTQQYSAQKSIDIARAEVGTRHQAVDPATGSTWDQPGQCIKSAQRWIDSAGGHFGGGGVVTGYTNSGAVSVDMSQVQPGDVLQLTSDVNSDGNWAHVHTVLVAGVHADGTYDIIQSNSPANSGLVTEVPNWSPTSSYAGWQWRAWRFAAQP